MIGEFKFLERLIKPVKIYNRYFFKPVKGFSFDSRSIKRGEAFIAFNGKHKDGHRFIKEAAAKGASLIIAQKDTVNKPKVPYFIVENSQDVLGEIASYIIKKKRPFVYGITGSVGKTTTKDMLAYLLDGKYRILKNKKTENNLLGVTKTIFSLSDEDVLILELGTNSLGEIKTLSQICRPDVGIITFIKAVHLEGLKSMKNIFEEKVSLLKVNSKIHAVLNRDDNYLRRVDFCKKVLWFGKSKDCDIYAKLIKRDNEKSTFLICDEFRLDLPFQFEGFIANALAAISGANLRGLSIKEAVERMNEFSDFPCGRMQIKQLGRFLIINDAYNANPYAFSQALKITKRYPQKKIAVIGDMMELGKKSIYYHRLLADKIIANHFEYCLTMGEHTRHLKKRLDQLGYRKAFHFDSHEDLGNFIDRRVKNGCMIFLKGSRKMALEKIIDVLDLKEV